MFEREYEGLRLDAKSVFFTIIAFGILIAAGLFMLRSSGEYTSLYLRTEQGVNVFLDGKSLTPCNNHDGCQPPQHARRSLQFKWGVLTGNTYEVEARRGNKAIASLRIEPKPGQLHSFELDGDDEWTAAEAPVDAEEFKPEMDALQ